MCVSSVSMPEHLRRAESSQEPCLAFDTYRGRTGLNQERLDFVWLWVHFPTKSFSIGEVDLLEIHPKALLGDPGLGSPSLPQPSLPPALLANPPFGKWIL